MRRARRDAVPTVLTPSQVKVLGRYVDQNPEVLLLRAQQEALQIEVARLQWQYNRLAHIYHRRIDIDYKMEPGTWKTLGSRAEGEALMWRRGRPGVLPSDADLRSAGWLKIVLSPAVAAALIARAEEKIDAPLR